MTLIPETEAPLDYKQISMLKAKAEGLWPQLLVKLSPKLKEAVEYSPFHVPCPVHGGENGFRLFGDFSKTGGGVCNTCGAKSNGLVLLAWVLECSINDAALQVAGLLDTNIEPMVAAQKAMPLPKATDPVKALARNRKIWTSSTPLAGTAAEKYLVARGIWPENLPPTLRAHPGLPYIYGKEKTNYGTFPCLLAHIKDAEGLVSIHRIFLTPEGAKADVPAPKRMMPAHRELRGAAIKLFPAGETLGLTEGIENALAAHAISRMPVWACVSAVLMELVEIPANVKRVVIWADLDRSGRGIEAAEKLATRLEAQGIVVEIWLPQAAIPEGEKGIDWLDVMLTQGINGFPPKWRRWRPPVAVA